MGVLGTPFQQHYSAAIEHLEQGRPEKAAQRFRQAAIADPEEWNNSARLIAKAGHPEVAIAALREAIRLHDGRKDALAVCWCTIGNILYEQGNNEVALEHFQESWKHWKTGGASSNIALINLRRGRLDEAAKWIETSLGIDPWCAESQMIQADISFNQGDYQKGFKQYECRWRSRRHGLKKIASNHPEWTGKEKGHLLVFGEQGMGDVILALRYARLIKDLGLEQTWVIQPGMKPLAESMGLIDRVLGPGEPVPDSGYHISSCSLPRVLGTSLETVPSMPYLSGWRPLKSWGCGAHDKPRIGICWRGNSANPNNPFRSTNLAQWAGILEIPDIEFHSFQFGDGEDEAKAFPVQIYPRPVDWLSTRIFASAMDLIVSVDTAMVHLAGAMGMPCWVPMHCRPYWAYPLCCGDRTPWYPSVKLFRQTKEFEWQPVFTRIADELRGLLSANGASTDLRSASDSSVGEEVMSSPETPMAKPSITPLEH